MFVFVNQAFAEMYGYESAEAVMSLGSAGLQVSKIWREPVSRYAAACEAGREAPPCYELQALRTDGS